MSDSINHSQVAYTSVRRRNLKRRRIWGITIISVLLLWAVAVVFFDPATNPWMPQCVLHMLTGLDCPTCGSTRAVYALMHGQIGTALSLNWFVIITLPLGVLLLFALVVPCRFSDKIEQLIVRPWFAYSYIFIYVAWGIIRNIL